jgi:hypothetical protein
MFGSPFHSGLLPSQLRLNHNSEDSMKQRKDATQEEASPNARRGSCGGELSRWVILCEDVEFLNLTRKRKS